MTNTHRAEQTESLIISIPAGCSFNDGLYADSNTSVDSVNKYNNSVNQDERLYIDFTLGGVPYDLDFKYLRDPTMLILLSPMDGMMN
jgi:hypothetical protein